jgi:hypothetical protein
MVEPLSFLVFHLSFLQLWMGLAWGGHALLGVGAAIVAAGTCSSDASCGRTICVLASHLSFRSILMSKGLEEESTVVAHPGPILTSVWAHPSGFAPGEGHRLKNQCEEPPSQRRSASVSLFANA